MNTVSSLALNQDFTNDAWLVVMKQTEKFY